MNQVTSTSQAFDEFISLIQLTLSASWCPGLTCNTLCSVFSQL